jgi:hypothetical protein
VDEQGRLIRVFWADAMSRKNYSLFGDVVSFDATYTTNEYNMIFTPFTRVNHHLQNIFLRAAFLTNEKVEWLFKTFLKPSSKLVAEHTGSSSLVHFTLFQLRWVVHQDRTINKLYTSYNSRLAICISVTKRENIRNARMA